LAHHPWAVCAGQGVQWAAQTRHTPDLSPSRAPRWQAGSCAALGWDLRGPSPQSLALLPHPCTSWHPLATLSLAFSARTVFAGPGVQCEPERCGQARHTRSHGITRVRTAAGRAGCPCPLCAVWLGMAAAQHRRMIRCPQQATPGGQRAGSRQPGLADLWYMYALFSFPVKPAHREFGLVV
jgi:hypothetical protein